MSTPSARSSGSPHECGWSTLWLARARTSGTTRSVSTSTTTSYMSTGRRRRWVRDRLRNSLGDHPAFLACVCGCKIGCIFLGRRIQTANRERGTQKEQNTREDLPQKSTPDTHAWHPKPTLLSCKTSNSYFYYTAHTATSRSRRSHARHLHRLHRGLCPS